MTKLQEKMKPLVVKRERSSLHSSMECLDNEAENKMIYRETGLNEPTDAHTIRYPFVRRLRTCGWEVLLHITSMSRLTWPGMAWPTTVALNGRLSDVC